MPLSSPPVVKPDLSAVILGIPLAGVVFLWSSVGMLNIEHELEAKRILWGVLVAVVVGSAVAIAVEARGLERRSSANKSPRGWMNWVVGVALFWVVAYPLYLWRRKAWGLKNQLIGGLFAVTLFFGSVLMLMGLMRHTRELQALLQHVEAGNQQSLAANRKLLQDIKAFRAAHAAVVSPESLQSQRDRQCRNTVWQLSVVIGGSGQRFTFRVFPGTDAAALGALKLMSGDVIESIDGRAVTQQDDLYARLRSVGEGQDTVWGVRRGGSLINVKIGREQAMSAMAGCGK